MRLERLRSFLLLHPPLVVFIFCIGMTAIAFVSFGYYIRFNRVRNHDVQKVSFAIFKKFVLIYL